MDEIANTVGKLGPHALMIGGINVIILFFIRPFLSKRLRDKLLPTIAVLLGVVFTPLFFKDTIIQFEIPYPKLALCFQGLLYGVSAIGINSTVRSMLSKAGVNTGDTMIIEKEQKQPPSV